jgi:hypothetical protein
VNGPVTIDALTSALSAALSGTNASAAAPARGAVVVVAQTVTNSDASVVKRAKAILAQLQAANLVRSELSPELSSEYTPEVLAHAASTLPAGAPLTFVQESKADRDGTTTYVFRAGWQRGTVDLVFGFDDTTYQIVKLFTRPGPPT